MGSAARFSALLLAGVAIVVLYVRTGESPVVLVLSLITLIVALYLVDAKPWAVDGGEDESGDPAGSPDRGSDRGPTGRGDTWRCGHDVTWDERGITAVAVGKRMPQLVVWSRVDGVDVGMHRAGPDERRAVRRRGIRLGLHPRIDRSGRRNLWLRVGPEQEPDRVAADLRSAWRAAQAEWPRPEPDRIDPP